MSAALSADHEEFLSRAIPGPRSVPKYRTLPPPSLAALPSPFFAALLQQHSMRGLVNNHYLLANSFPLARVRAPKMPAERVNAFPVVDGASVRFESAIHVSPVKSRDRVGKFNVSFYEIRR